MKRYVRIENVTRGTVVASRCRVARSAVDRSVGLLRTPEVLPGEGLLIERSPSIHMFFMRYPIDVIFVDKQLRVTKVVSRLKPWRIVAWARGARDCIELRAGALEESGSEPGDQLTVLPFPGERERLNGEGLGPSSRRGHGADVSGQSHCDGPPLTAR
jgi:uncharacterized membrane protein (UPF0127 family)